ncbi:hypothetical protein [Hugenholtzia roseola]|uniref:hypothetical protein n=1 Tax=Hugenholtzia roseola TaxID=1002 RepID=UPI000405C636|nr:hypothetical protein [Hugenholtzia roseola]
MYKYDISNYAPNDEFNRLRLHGWRLSIGDTLKRAQQIFHAQLGLFIGYFVVAYLILIVGSLILSCVPFIGNFAGSVLSVCLYAGYYIVSFKISQEQNVEFADFFEGFKKGLPLGLYAIVSTFIIALGAIPFAIMFVMVGVFSNPEVFTKTITDNPIFLGLFVIASLFFGIYALYISAMYLLAPYLITFSNLSFWDAMEISRKTMRKNMSIGILFLIVSFLINLLGVLALLVGLLYTVPLTLIAGYVFYDILLQQNGNIGAETNNSDMPPKTGDFREGSPLDQF